MTQTGRGPETDSPCPAGAKTKKIGVLFACVIAGLAAAVSCRLVSKTADGAHSMQRHADGLMLAPLPQARSDKGLRLQLVAPTQPFADNEPVGLTIIVLNSGEQAAELPPLCLHGADRMGLACTYSTDLTYAGAVARGDPACETLVYVSPEPPFPDEFEFARLIKWGYSTLPPDRQEKWHFDLRRSRPLLRAGRYRVCVEYKADTPKLHVHLVSNTVCFDIAPRAGSEAAGGREHSVGK